MKTMLVRCLYCKRFRDDYGVWTDLKEYKGDEPYSSSICPDCVGESRKELEKLNDLNRDTK